MKLSRFLPLSIGLIWILVFAGTLAITLGNSRQHQAWQMQTHAQDTATFLGLALTAGAHNDAAAATSMVDAIFDRGYYSAIIVRKTDGQVIVQRSQAPYADAVPAWFIALLPLSAPPRPSPGDGWLAASRHGGSQQSSGSGLP